MDEHHCRQAVPVSPYVISEKPVFNAFVQKLQVERCLVAGGREALFATIFFNIICCKNVPPFRPFTYVSQLFILGLNRFLWAITP
jgi:hypothetical protein